MEYVTAGIDLGTTNSVIAIPGEYDAVGIVFDGVTVITDEVGRATHASAVCCFGDELIIGDDALQMAKQGLAPIRFFKKFMGTNKQFPLGEKMLSPEDVGALIVKYLVEMANRRLREQKIDVVIERAVITHPAYFDVLAIQATRRAGELAGIEVARLVEEPTAAATACAEASESKGMTVVFDMGGGTFDVTLLARSKGGFHRIHCDGDRELGGYNVDKQIAIGMHQQISKNYVLPIDQENPDRDPRWGTLMYFAERAKRHLGSGDEPKHDTIELAVFTDDSSPPKSVQLRHTLTQDLFREMVQTTLIEPALKTLDKTILDGGAKLPPSDSDAVAGSTKDDKDKDDPEDDPKMVGALVLVGGSCRIEHLRDALASHTRLDAEIDDDVLDLSVAVGAAKMAAQLGRRVDRVSINDIPEATPDISLMIGGAVAPTDDSPNIANLNVAVTGGAESASTLTAADGRFIAEVELTPYSENFLELVVSDGEQVLLRRQFTVWHLQDAVPPTPPPTTMLAQAISVGTKSGLSRLANEGELLPYMSKERPFRTVEETRRLDIQFFQDNVVLADVVLGDFDPPIPAKTMVKITIEVDEHYSMKALITAGGKPHEFPIQLRPFDLPSHEVLRDEFTQARSGFWVQLENSPQNVETAMVAAEGERLIEETAKLLEEAPPELMRICMNVRRLGMLTLSLPQNKLQPSEAELTREIQTLIQDVRAAVAKRPELAMQEYEETLNSYLEELPTLAAEVNLEKWKQIADHVQQIRAAITPPPPPDQLMWWLRALCEETRGDLANPAVPAQLRAEGLRLLDQAEAALAAIDVSNESASFELFKVYRTYIEPATRCAGKPINIDDCPTPQIEEC